MKVKMFTSQGVDTLPVQDNFRRLVEALDQEPILRGNFKFFEITLPQAVTGLDYSHNLGFQPSDVILVTVTDGATVTWHHSNFTKTTVQFTTSAGCTIRCFIGSYSKANGPARESL